MTMARTARSNRLNNRLANPLGGRFRSAGWLAAGLIAAGVTLAAAMVPAMAQNAPAKTAAADGKSDKKPGAEPAKNLDVLIFKSGRTVEGVILEETAGQVKIKVVSKGGLSVETTYDKSEILEVQKGKGSPIDAAGKPTDAKPDPKDAKPAKSDDKSASGPSVYLVHLTGELGRDIASTDLREVMSDVKKYQPDVLIFKVDMDFKFYGEEVPDYVTSTAGPAFNQLETVRELQTMVTDEIRDDAGWANKPRLVMWVRKALGGAAFLPFVAKEIYYTSDAHHGGIGYLERMFDGVGDKVAQEKQYSLRLGRAEGLAIKGGHEPMLIKAMARADYVLSVTFVGGRPEFHEDESGEMLLTDDGKEGNRDTLQDVVRFKGNDVLTLDAPLAERLGLSLGTVDTVEDLLTKLGIDKGHRLIDGRSDEIIATWGRAVSEAHVEFRRLYRELQRVPTGGQTYDERSRNRGRQINLYTDMLALLNKYGEALNPRELRGMPDDVKHGISIRIEEIKTQQRLDKRK
jgi:hypothetical protein